MGSSHSQQHLIQTPQWAHSYPRPRHAQPQVKVLPERIPPLQLKTTDNGAILQNGGTISCRKQGVVQGDRMYRPRSSSAHRQPNLEDVTLEKTRFGSEPDLRFHLKEQREQYEENAVRQRISRSRKKYKAPPAPQNVPGSGVESSSPDVNAWEASSKDCPARKARLFKTRAESSKKSLVGPKKQEAGEFGLSRSTEALNVSRPKSKEGSQLSTNRERMEKKGLKRCASHEVISINKGLVTPEFQAELLEAAQRLRPQAGVHTVNPAEGNCPYKDKPKDNSLSTLNIEIPKENEFKQNRKIIRVNESKEIGYKHQRNVTSARGNSSAETKRDKCERDVPSKKFYFGMKENENEVKIVNSCASTNNVDKTNTEHRITAVEKSKNLRNLYKSVSEGKHEWEDTVDKFAASFHKSQMLMPNGNTTSCSSSFVSDPDEDIDGGIALQLRPTLPKKQLEIPRFSPTAAWRLLSSVESFSQAPSPGGSEEGPLVLDDGFRPPRHPQGLRGNHDKSGDSGISGDASPGGCHESSSEIAATSSPKALTTQNSKNILMAWTPQQDLEEESSSDDFESPINSSKNVPSNIPGAKFSPRGQLLFTRDQPLSKSAPKDERINFFAETGDVKERVNGDTMQKLNSLTKLKAALGTSKKNEALDGLRSHSDNWVLSKSVPGSLNNSHGVVAKSVSNPSSPEQEEEYCQQTSLNYPSYSYLTSGGRMMYLPEYHSRMSPDVLRKHLGTNAGNGFLSKSCENIARSEMKQLGRSRTPSPAADRGNNDESSARPEESRLGQKKKKFTFQSTVRLLENRRLAERLSREAELKENQRLSEVEAMKRVEEEFQKKRAREKASIRQQLRLYSLEEKNYSSLPPATWEENRGESRACAPSSLPPTSAQAIQSCSSRKLSPEGKTPGAVVINKFTPATQVLSEYREPTRDYRDYRYSRYHESQEFISDVEPSKKSVVEHPKMVYDIPKNTAVYIYAPGNNNCFGQSSWKEEFRVGMSVPRSSSSDNYRKDFAHGALPAGGKSLTSSDSELSQAHLRSSSRGALNRSRSSSQESVTLSGPPSRRSEPRDNVPRSRSASPFKITESEEFTSISPGCRSQMSPEEKHGNDSLCFDPESALNVKMLQKKLSNPGEYHSHTNPRQLNSVDDNSCRNSERQKNFEKGADGPLRFGLPSLQPFNKAEKSFRPVNFNPIINKVAQPVT